MIRLHRQASQFEGIKLNMCGLVFLSTPHSGTTEADWNQFLLSISEITLGVRSHAIVDQLKSFNSSSVDSEEEFAAMSTVPPFHCFCEGEKTLIVGKYRTVSDTKILSRQTKPNADLNTWLHGFPSWENNKGTTKEWHVPKSGTTCCDSVEQHAEDVTWSTFNHQLISFV